MARRWRRIRLWLRQRRVALWLAVLLGLAGLAYGMVRFADFISGYAPNDYEPKDIERQRQIERGPGR